MSERPTPLTDEATRAAGGQWTFLARDLSRNLERQLAAATEEREQMGKQAHANACEAMSYRRQLTEARTALKLIIGKNSMLRGYSAEEAASDAKQALARINAKGTT